MISNFLIDLLIYWLIDFHKVNQSPLLVLVTVGWLVRVVHSPGCGRCDYDEVWLRGGDSVTTWIRCHSIWWSVCVCVLRIVKVKCHCPMTCDHSGSNVCAETLCFFYFLVLSVLMCSKDNILVLCCRSLLWPCSEVVTNIWHVVTMSNVTTYREYKEPTL